MPSRTAAADRILAAASEFARDRNADAADAADLLRAVIAEESRGAELLLRFAIDAAAAPLSADEDRPPSVVLNLSGDAAADAMPHTAALNSTLEAAYDEARRAGRGTELDSVHLAIGLAAAETAVGDWLAEHGVNAQVLREHSNGPTEAIGQPISIDFALDPNAESADRGGLLRAIDAAANRAAEGLRVAEDLVRFVRDDAFLTARLKALRHAIVAALAELPIDQRLRNRNTRGDVGTKVSSPSAAARHTTGELLAANLHRSQEALRSLEEFGRLVHPPLGPRFESLRYELYTLEKTLAGIESARERLGDRNLYVLLSQAHCLLPVEEIIQAAATGGAGIFQVREKSLPDRELLKYLRRVRTWTRQTDSLLIVNDRPDLAVLCEADGVHVGQEELTAREARRIVGPNRLVGVSTHDIHQAREAVLDGADYLGVGPTFPSRTKEFATFAGLEFVSAVAAEIRLPWFAIGGIDLNTVAEARTAGATRIAVSAAICGSEDPRNAAAALR